MRVWTPPGLGVWKRQYFHCKSSISSFFMLIIILRLEWNRVESSQHGSQCFKPHLSSSGFVIIWKMLSSSSCPVEHSQQLRWIIPRGDQSFAEQFSYWLFLGEQSECEGWSSVAMWAFLHSCSSATSCTDSEMCPLPDLLGKPRLLQAGCRRARRVSGCTRDARGKNTCTPDTQWDTQLTAGVSPCNPFFLTAM